MSTAAIQKYQPSIIDTLANASWTREVFEVIRKLRVPRGCTEEEFYVYLKQCQASGLNPLLGHAYCVPRRTKVSAKGEPDKWVTNHVFQPAIDGMRARAAEFPDFDGVDSGAIYEKDLITIDKGTGEIAHKTNPVGQRGNLRGAWARVRKTSGRAYVVELPVGARSGSSDFWTNDPGGMLCKCAEAAALRKAYPRAFGGMHIREEMPEDAAREPTRVELIVQAAGGGAPAKETPALPPPGPVVRFGAFNGRPLAALTPEEREQAVREGEWWLDQNPKAKPKVRENVQAAVEEVRNFGKAPSAVVEDAEEVPSAPAREPLPISHPDAQPPDEAG